MSDSLYQEALTKKRQDIWSKWYRDIYNNSTIEDFREEIYGSPDVSMGRFGQLGRMWLSPGFDWRV
jgi:hypothetical protein